MRVRYHRGQSLWVLTFPPAIWGTHFLACYFTAAVYCAKLGRDAGLGPVRPAIAAYTLVALVLLAWLAMNAWRRHASGVNQPLPHEEPTAGDRYRFMGFTTLLLCGISALAVLFAAMVALFFETCR